MAATERPRATERLSLAILAVGAGAGLIAAALALLDPWHAASNAPAGAAATVNGAIISQDKYQRGVAALASDSKDPLDDAQRRWVLERLIEEELLVQRGLALGLPESEKGVRAAIVRAMIASVVAQADSQPVNDDDLRRFYAQNAVLFASTQRLRVAAFIAPDRAAALAARRQAAQGIPLPRQGAVMRASTASLVPDTFLPFVKLREYVGPTAARAVAALAVGETTAPIPQGGGFLVLELLGRQPGSIPAFEQVRAEVLAEYRKQAGDKALSDYLERLKQEAMIRRAPVGQ